MRLHILSLDFPSLCLPSLVSDNLFLAPTGALNVTQPIENWMQIKFIDAD